MPHQVHPPQLTKAVDLIDANPARAWTLDELAAVCRVARRTLQKQFRRYIGQSPVQYLRGVRLEHVRRALLRAPRGTSVAEIAEHSGFNHHGRLATWYRDR